MLRSALQHLVHVLAGVLEQLVLLAEDDDTNLALAEDGKLHGLLQQPRFSLHERHLPIALLGYRLNDDLLAAHPSLGD